MRYLSDALPVGCTLGSFDLGRDRAAVDFGACIVRHPMATHPNDLLALVDSLAPLIRESADEAERLTHLPAAVSEAIAGAGLFRIAAPAFLGGREIHPVEQLAVIEAVSQLDGSTGWNLMIGIELLGALGGVLPQAQARLLFEDPKLLVCGALNPAGRALRVDGGYRVSGSWPFISGCHNATIFWGQCVVVEGAKAASESARPVMREALVAMPLCQIHPTWDVSGLRGSGSHEVRLDHVFVPDSMMTQSFAGLQYKESTLFRLPPFSRLVSNKVGVATGIARAAIDEFVELAAKKTPRGSSAPLRERAHVQVSIVEAEVALSSARAWVVESLTQLWNHVAEGRAPSPRDRALVHLACTHACSAAVQAVAVVHELAGSTSNFRGNPLERRFRDVQVVRQHVLLSRRWYDGVGRVLLGLPSGSMLF
jgi:indole-3-acetate monooxygenase